MGYGQWRKEMEAFHKYIYKCIHTYISAQQNEGSGDDEGDDKTKHLPFPENVAITSVLIRAQKHLPEMGV